MHSLSEMRLRWMIAGVFLFLACTPLEAELTAAEKEQIARQIRAQVTEAYEITRPDALNRLMSLYPATGPIYSAGAGRFTAAAEPGDHEAEPGQCAKGRHGKFRR